MCRGDGRNGQLGNLPRKLNTLNTPTLVPVLCAPTLDIAQKGAVCFIACGLLHTAAITTKGNLYMWGSGKYGQTGLNSRLELREPQEVKEFDAKLSPHPSSTTTAAPTNNTLLLSPSSSAAAAAAAAHIITGGVRFVSVSCGDRHTCAVTAPHPVSGAGGGWIASWGSGAHGQLGHGNLVDYVRPKRVEALAHEPIRAVVCGANFTVAVGSM
jgi:alpha-tubulin suppressor-like RCC1 family protein